MNDIQFLIFIIWGFVRDGSIYVWDNSGVYIEIKNVYCVDIQVVDFYDSIIVLGLRDVILKVN